MLILEIVSKHLDIKMLILEIVSKHLDIKPLVLEIIQEFSDGGSIFPAIRPHTLPPALYWGEHPLSSILVLAENP